jgi:hypothetical protein
MRVGGGGVNKGVSSPFFPEVGVSEFCQQNRICGMCGGERVPERGDVRRVGAIVWVRGVYR